MIKKDALHCVLGTLILLFIFNTNASVFRILTPMKTGL